MTETCRACDALATGATTLDVTPDDSIPLCARHWNWWLEQYTWLHPMDEKPVPPCAAHLIPTAPKETDR